MKLKEFIQELEKVVNETLKIGETNLLESDFEGAKLYQLVYTPKVGFFHGSTCSYRIY
ncbi:hypothetical protein [uncultured Tenacibaculum sp.]|uniref:hypothetical protein n=1 Tax=uncultured Tenacibaculum sp. TaxID=174713 RepID=UPI00261F724A|nr:hypothetical protein [uncultured Tenacibaculum sp.]